MVCTGWLPAWVTEVVAACPFLFPLHARHFYTAVTAFGISRALHAMQRLHPAPADAAAGDVRIGRIQRDKIRVAHPRTPRRRPPRDVDMCAGPAPDGGGAALEGRLDRALRGRGLDRGQSHRPPPPPSSSSPLPFALLSSPLLSLSGGRWPRREARGPKRDVDTGVPATQGTGGNRR